ncbi:hypothetical protein GQ53DRAFT_856395 [Thozetella sp. PMI_491]|nr:hypothetical protein GQ53DRAFT_856395 [Thozetella sp. PMI_491]
MEPVGLAVGVVGLLGLFSTCLEAVERVDAYREFGRDSHHLATRFEAERLRFQQWGRAVGIAQSIGRVKRHQERTAFPPGSALSRSTVSLEEAEVCLGPRGKRTVWNAGRHSSRELYEDSLQKRLDGTCEWVLGRPEFRAWLAPGSSTGEARLLWIHGSAGFGKTVLCARVIEYLLAALETPVSYFFVSSNSASREDPFLAIRSWITQIISHNQVAFQSAYETFQGQEELTATRATIAKLFRDIVQVVPCCTFVLDGLDECSWIGQGDGGSGSVAGFLDTVLQAVAGTTTRILVVSRDEYEIRSVLGSAGATELRICPEDVGSDLSLYARSIVDKRLPRKDEVTKGDLAQKMARRCDGQFLWLRLQEGALLDWKNKKQLERIIDSTAPGLDRLYERDWERILKRNDEDKSRAVSLLRWTAFALRPLTVMEITEALLADGRYDDLAVDEMPDEINDDYIYGGIISLCGALLEVRSISTTPSAALKTIHIAHFSVKQFLLSNGLPQEGLLLANEGLRYTQEELQNAELAKACLRYVEFQGTQKSLLGDSNADTSFHDYASGSWYQHASWCGDMDPYLVKMITALFNEKNTIWERWTRWYNTNDE